MNSDKENSWTLEPNKTNLIGINMLLVWFRNNLTYVKESRELPWL